MEFAKLIRLFAFWFPVLLIQTVNAQQAVFPLVGGMKQSGKNIHFNHEVVLYYDVRLANEANYLKEELRKRHGFKQMFCLKMPTRQDVPAGPNLALKLIMPDTLLPEGWYSLSATAAGTEIRAASETGVFYGIQTLLQLVKNNSGRAELPETIISGDFPAFRYRGMHLDVCRHFFPVAFIKKYIDLLAIHKMNYFHWHLTEDQGWRIEIEKYPNLTSIGAWRKGSMVGKYSDQKYDNIRYGGFYSKDEIREIVAYAAERHITVVPEIEMPGHALAALASYPKLSCTGGPFEVARGWGVFDDVYCTREETFEFLYNVLDEVCELFPGEYIHIGGDECPKTRWKTCNDCQNRIKEEGLKDEHELQSWFIRRIERYLNQKGKKMIGWDEILEGGLAPNATVMSWRGTEGGIAAATQNHDVIMTPGSHCYFDHYQGKPEKEPLAIGGFTDLEKVFSFNPIPAGLPADKTAYILGAQANVWTEYILNEAHVEYMVLPRMTALSQVLWSGNNKGTFKNFEKGLFAFMESLKAQGYNYRKP
jgi:hexosaminidase